MENDGLVQTDRFNIAKLTVLFVFIAITALGVSAIVFSSDDKKMDSVKDILSLILPVISAWAGTVFAFYFSRENFESAAKSTASLVKQLTSEEKLKSLKASENMIKIEAATRLILNGPENTVKIKEDMINKKFTADNRERLPILDPKNLIKYITHRSIVERFVLQEVSKGRIIDDLTLADMLSDTYYANIIKGGFRTIKPNDTLADAKTLMDNINICSDIFVTEDGTEKSQVLGWITNNDLLEKSKV